MSYSYPTPTTFESVMNFNGTVSTLDKLIATDGLGRQIFRQARQGQGASMFDSIQTSYGWNSTGAFTKTTLPYSGTVAQPAPSGTGSVTTQNDVTYRPLSLSDTGGGLQTGTYSQNDVLSVASSPPSGENTKQVQNQYDGLGRLTKSCAIGNGSSTACGQNTGMQNGVTTSYSYTAATGSQTTSATRGSQTRSQTFDALGRLTSETKPESGTTSYVYDFYASGVCAGATGGKGVTSEPGDLMLKTLNNGLQVCFLHDSLHRLTDEQSSSADQCKRFRYDKVTNAVQAVPSGYSAMNVSGRLIEAETDTCSAYPPTQATMITDEWFSYDADGNVTDIWEMTPHSGQYYHSKAAFYANGKVNMLQLASPSLYTMTWGLDGEGRWNTLTDTTSGKALVTGATFFPAANPAVVSLIGTDKDSFTFDQNTGQMKKYVFTVGSSSMTGNLAWSSNGTLNQLAITDGFNSGGTQTCNFNPTVAPGTGYDDLGRLVGVDCGSGQWGQTFSYDIYDNLSKSASFSGRIGTTWNPVYSATTNHCNGCTYDADGNVTGDGNNVYGWDGFSKLTWTAPSGTPTCGSSGRCAVYDAFGRMVERSVGTTWYEQWFTQGGTAWMSGSTINYAYWPAPEGGRVLLYGNSTNYDYLHPDWLGNARIDSDLIGHTIKTDQAYTPYGEIYDIFGSNVGQNEIFATMEGHLAGGTTTPVMWDTPNRELSIVSRWLSPDPAGVGWNQYAYVTNPNSMTDPTGLGGQCPVSPNCNSLPPGQDPTRGCTVSIDGQELPCGLLGSGGESTVVCPDGNCNVFGRYTGTDSNGAPFDLQLVPGVNGSTWINNFNAQEASPFGVATEFGLLLPMSSGFQSLLPAVNSCQAPFLCNRPPVANVGALPPTPQNKVQKVTAGCVGQRLVDNFVGPTGSVTVTTVLNVAGVAVFRPAVASLLPGPGWVYTGAAVAYDLGIVGKSYVECRNGGGQPVVETPADDQPEEPE